MLAAAVVGPPWSRHRTAGRGGAADCRRGAAPPWPPITVAHFLRSMRSTRRTNGCDTVLAPAEGIRDATRRLSDAHERKCLRGSTRNCTSDAALFRTWTHVVRDRMGEVQQSPLSPAPRSSPDTFGPLPPPPLIASGSLGLDLLMSIAGEFSDENSKAIRRAFPKLRRFTIVAPETASHNCIGWSLCSPDYGWVWPGDDPEEYDILYGRFGWVQVKDCEPEAGMRKLALFRDRAGVTHAAKEVADSGWWESKLGRSFRVRHRLQELEGGPYGRVFRCYGRPEPNANWEKDSGSGGSSG